MGEPVVELRSVSKSFGGTRALDRVSLALAPGEVHVLAGSNGAGKSTLIKILSGVHTHYEGEMRLGGRPVRLRSPRDADAAGIATIHQELSLVGPMSVTDNLFLGRGAGWRLRDRGGERQRARRILGAMDLDVDVDAPAESLSLALRQLVEIARALARRARLLVMDEPTSALGEREAERLFEQIDRLRDDGCAILYISHRMDEIDRLADRLTVLRDGRRVDEGPAGDFSRQRLVTAMVGRALPTGDRQEAPLSERTVLEVRELSARGRGSRLAGVDFDLRAGEVLGFTGLEGSGASLVTHALFGAAEAIAGRVVLDGAPLEPEPRTCIRRGVILLSGDRHESLVAPMSVVHNLSLSSLRNLWVNRKRERAEAAAQVDRLGVDAPSLDAPMWQLSGGNQQKVALGRCLSTEPAVLLLDDPTRGVDVGARADVYDALRSLSDRGVSTLVSTSETDELIRICHRIVVLSRGRVTAELAGAQCTRERILAAAMGAR